MKERRPLALVVSERDQVLRLRTFRRQYPQVIIGTLGLGGAWQACVPQDDGEIVLTRYQLKDLLDKLAELLGEQETDQTSQMTDQESADGPEQS
jgi:hypothetical protein